MTALSVRLRAAAEAERLSDAGLALIPLPCSDDETRVTLDGVPILGVDGKGGCYYAWAVGEGETFGPGYCSPLTDWYPTHEAAIRAGLLALAEREEARG